MSVPDPHELVRRWAEAEAAQDSATLETLLAPDFRGIGPLGFVLDRDQWLRRFDDGLSYRRTDLSAVEVREHDPVAVAVGVWDQDAEYRGRSTPGRFRTGMVLHRDAGGWRVLGIQLSGPMPDPVQVAS